MERGPDPQQGGMGRGSAVEVGGTQLPLPTKKGPMSSDTGMTRVPVAAVFALLAEACSLSTCSIMEVSITHSSVLNMGPCLFVSVSGRGQVNSSVTYPQVWNLNHLCQRSVSWRPQGPTAGASVGSPCQSEWKVLETWTVNPQDVPRAPAQTAPGTK
jgi:hypothetical protein